MRETQFNRMDHTRKMQALARAREINMSHAIYMDDKLTAQARSSLLQEEKASMKNQYFR